jgi:glutaredoxin
MSQIRMYVQKGCPHCDAAKQFFESRKAFVEVIEIGFDRIIQEGMRVLSSDGKGLPVPLIISFATQEIIIGTDNAQLDRIATAAGYPPITPDPAV